MRIIGTYFQTADGLLKIDVKGHTPGQQHDQLLVTGQVRITAGKLDVTTDAALKLKDDDQFVFIRSERARSAQVRSSMCRPVPLRRVGARSRGMVSPGTCS